MDVSVQQERPDVCVNGLQIVVSEAPTTTTITLAGEWDLAQREATQRVVDDVLSRAPGRVVLDLRRVSFIDSSGVHAVVQLADGSAPLKIELLILRGPRPVHRVFEICQLIERLPFDQRPMTELND